jgi:tetratricopeptide (TPR) repeat protein
MKKKQKQHAEGNRLRQPSASISQTKKRLFLLALVMLPLLFFVLLEVGLCFFDYGESTALFIPIPEEDSKYLGVNPKVCKRYFSKIDFLPSPRKDLFLKDKPAECYRIFVLGGSTTAGFPYGNNLMFTRILHRRLMDTFPDRRIEVVNTAFSAINSYTLLDFMDEILQQQPDALLIYAGHNEFYGALGVGSAESLARNRWIVKSYLKLQKFKTFDLVRDVVAGAFEMSSGKNDDAADPIATAMARIAKEQSIPLHGELYEAGITQFSENLKEIVQKAKAAGVAVMLSELVSNVRDQEPFISAEIDSLPDAAEIFNRAKELEKSGKFEAARAAYYRAKDLDLLRFRAPQIFNRIIREVALENDIPCVPMQSYFENASSNGLIGTNLILEHVHPNIDGYFLMAEAFYETLQKEKFINSSWDAEDIGTSELKKAWRYTALDSVYGALTIVQLKGDWPFRQTPGRNIALLNYEAKTKQDSIVLKILTQKNMTLETGHIELAKFYEAGGELEKAFSEYAALVQIMPYWDLFYQPAVDVLLKMKDYERALSLLHELLRFEESTYVYKSLGQTCLALGKVGESIPFLEKAVTRSQWDTEALNDLGVSYCMTLQNEKAKAVLARLQKIDRSSSEAKQLSSLIEKTEAATKGVSAYLNEAQALLRSRKLDEAFDVLTQSLTVQETGAAHELLGEILLVKGETSKAIEHLEKAHNMETSPHPKLLYNLSTAYYLVKDFDKAWQTFSTFRKNHPNAPDRGDLEMKIKRAMGNNL